jgi:hypothetical protein
VARHRWSADRKLIGELLDRAIAIPKQVDDSPAVGVAERDEGIGDLWCVSDCSMVTGLLP